MPIRNNTVMVANGSRVTMRNRVVLPATN